MTVRLFHSAAIFRGHRFLRSLTTQQAGREQTDRPQVPLRTSWTIGAPDESRLWTCWGW